MPIEQGHYWLDHSQLSIGIKNPGEVPRGSLIIIYNS